MTRRRLHIERRISSRREFQGSGHVAGDTSGDENAVIRVHPRSSASHFRVSAHVAGDTGSAENGRVKRTASPQLLPRPFQVQRQQPRQDFNIGQIDRPAVRGEDRRVQRAVRQVEPRFLLCEALCQAQLR